MASLRKIGKYYHIVYRTNGKQKSISTKSTNKLEALNQLNKFVYDQNDLTKNKRKVTSKYISPSEALEHFIHKKKLRENITLITEKSYRSVFRKVEELNLEYINDFTPDHFDQIIEQNNISRTSLSTISIHLKAIFNQLINDKIYTGDNPIIRIKPNDAKPNPIPPGVKIKYLLEAKRKRNNKLFNTMLLCYFFALRISEALRFDLSDVDFHNQLVTVKNSKGKRIDEIPLLKDARKFLQIAKIENEKIIKYDNYNTFRSAFDKLRNRIDSRYTIHDFRSARATDLLNSGVDIYFVKEYMRHIDISTTFKHYSKIDIDKQRIEMNSKL